MDYFEGILEYAHYNSNEKTIDGYSKLFIKDNCLRELVYSENKQLEAELIFNPNFKDYYISIDHLNDVVYKAEMDYPNMHDPSFNSPTLPLSKRIASHDCIGSEETDGVIEMTYICQNLPININYHPDYFILYKEQNYPLFYIYDAEKDADDLLFLASKEVVLVEQKELTELSFEIQEQDHPSYRRLTEADYEAEMFHFVQAYEKAARQFFVDKIEEKWERTLTDEEKEPNNISQLLDEFEASLTTDEEKIQFANELELSGQKVLDNTEHLKVKYDQILEQAGFPLKIDIQMTILKKNGLTGILYLLAQENYHQAVPLTDIEDTNCPWFAYKDLSPKDVISTIWAPLEDKLAYFIKLLKKRCQQLFVVENNGVWELVYFLDILIEERPYFAFYVGTAPVTAQELKENAIIANKVSKNLLPFYHIHNGYGEVNGESILPIDELGRTKNGEQYFLSFFDYGSSARQAINTDDLHDENPLTYDVTKNNAQPQQSFWKFLEDRLAYIDED